MSERTTPWDLIFGAPAFDASRFEQVKAEDEGRAMAPPELLMQHAAGALLRELLPPDPSDAGHAALAAQVSALVFHAYRFWLHGRTTHRIDAGALDALLAGAAPPDAWRFRTPAPAGYVQLPRNALWARIEEGAAAEPVDGFFWNAPPADSDDGSGRGPARLDLLLALGVRPGRPGLSLVDVSVEAPDALEQWARTDARPGAKDFANVHARRRTAGLPFTDHARPKC
jgi:hypothetical protein